MQLLPVVTSWTVLWQSNDSQVFVVRMRGVIQGDRLKKADDSKSSHTFLHVTSGMSGTFFTAVTYERE